ncbi:MAG: BON domain-containing protein [Novipirellula sp. JB048]
MIETIVAATRSIDDPALLDNPPAASAPNSAAPTPADPPLADPTPAYPTTAADPACTLDGEVSQMATERFRTCSYSAIRHVHCRFHEGVLVLSGQVPTFYMKQVAQELIRNLNSIEQINNRLHVPR